MPKSAATKVGSVNTKVANADLAFVNQAASGHLKMPKQTNRKQDPPVQESGRLEIGGVMLETDDIDKINQIFEGNRDASQNQANPEDPDTNSRLALQQYIADAKITALMSETLSNKEAVVKALEG